MISIMLFVARAWSQLAAVILLLVAGRLLSLTEFGEFTLASTIALFMNQFMCVGSSEYVIRHHESKTAADTALWVNVALATIYIAVGMVVAYFSASIFSSQRVMTIAMLLVPLSFFVGIRGVGGAILMRDGHLARHAITNMLVESIGLAVGIAALMAHWNVYALVASRWALGFAGLGFPVAAKWLPRFRFSKDEARGMMHLWRSMVADRALGYFQNYGADLLLGFFMTPAAVAIYRMGARIIALVTTIIYEPMRTLNWRILTRSHAEDGTIVPTTELIIGALYLLLFGPILLLGLTGGALVQLALGPQWAGVGGVIMLLAISVILNVPQQLSEPAYGVAGAIGRLPIQRVITLSISLALLMLLARLGPPAAAMSQAIAACFSFLVTARLQNRVLGMHPKNYVIDMIYALVFGVVALGAAELTRRYITSVMPAVAIVVLMIAVGMAVYVGLVFFGRRKPILQLAQLAEQRV